MYAFYSQLINTASTFYLLEASLKTGLYESILTTDKAALIWDLFVDFFQLSETGSPVAWVTFKFDR